MMNGTRRREDSDEEGDASYSDATVQRLRVSSGPSELSHYVSPSQVLQSSWKDTI
jgi:hypothetical protein